MSAYEFALVVLVALLVFLAFALTTTAIMFGNRYTTQAATKAFRALAKRLCDMFR